MNSWHIIIIELFVSCFFLLFSFAIFFAILVLRKKNPPFIKKGIVLLIVNMFLFGLVQLFCFSHSTYYKFNDWLILNSNVKTIIDKYGKYDLSYFKEDGSGMIGYYIYTDSGPIMPDYQKHYYFIYFNSEGKIYKVEDNISFGG